MGRAIFKSKILKNGYEGAVQRLLPIRSFLQGVCVGIIIYLIK